MIYEYFRVTGANNSVENYAELFTISLRNDDIQEFDSKWDGILLSVTKIPSDDILEGLYKLRIRESEKLKTVLELYDLETHQKKLGPDYHRLKTMVKRSIEQDLRNMNFGARNGNDESNAVVKNQGTKQCGQRILGDCWQWEANGQCVKGDNCSFRHDMNKRGKVTPSNPSPADQRRQVRRNVWWAASKRGKPCGKDGTTSKVHAVLLHAPSDLRGGTLLHHPRVLVATVGYQENPHLCLQMLYVALFHVFRCAYILLRVLAVTENQEAQELLDEIQQQPSVFVLSGPAIVITNLATVSSLLADGWSTECVSRVVRTARTRQESAHTTATYVTRWQFPTLFQPLFRDLRKVKIPQRTQYQNVAGSMRTWSTHQIAHWYGCHVLVEPSSDSFWQPPSTVAVLVRHRNVQLVQS